MKTLILAFFLIGITLQIANSQAPIPVSNENSEFQESLTKYLNENSLRWATDQVYAHLDRNVYFPGDTLFFQAYIKDRKSGEFETGSSSLYAMILDNLHHVLDSSRFRINNSMAPGWLVIPKGTKLGKYRFTAFTSQMQNYDASQAFVVDIQVEAVNFYPQLPEVSFNRKSYNSGDTIEALIKIVDASKRPERLQKISVMLSTGDINSDFFDTRTNYNGEAMVRFIIPDSVLLQPTIAVRFSPRGNPSYLRNVPVPFVQKSIELDLLPEGGTLIPGESQRIGFNAINERGQSVPVVGLLKLADGTIADTIRSGKYGPGYFECTPREGMYVELLSGDAPKKQWPLPGFSKGGLCLRVESLDNRTISVEIKASEYHSNSLYVAATMNTSLLFVKEVVMNKKQRILIKTDELNKGAIRITLFDKELKPVSERLVFVNPDKSIHFQFENDLVSTMPGGNSTIKVIAKGENDSDVQGFFSLAVIDSNSGYSPALFFPGIEYSFNYEPFLVGNLPPKVLVDGFDNMSYNDRDLLLMVFGWKKFNWDIQGTRQVHFPELTNYDELRMKLIKVLRKGNGKWKLDLVSIESPTVIHLKADQKGEINMPLDSLPVHAKSIILMPDVTSNRKIPGVMLSIPYNEKYFKSKLLLLPLPEIPPQIFDLPKYYSFDQEFDTAIHLPEITVKGIYNKKHQFLDKYEEMYQFGNVRSLPYEDLWSSFSFDEALMKLTTFIKQGNSIYLRTPTSILGTQKPALIILDGTPLYMEGYNIVRYIKPDQMTSLTVVKSLHGFNTYGEAANGGLIFVNTVSDDSALLEKRLVWKLQNSSDKMMLPLSVYRPAIEYYNPSGSIQPIDQSSKNNPTILWESEVYFDSKQPVSISFKNPPERTSLLLTINGVSVNNMYGSCKTSFGMDAK